MLQRLPPDSTGGPTSLWFRCPWCREDVAEAKIQLGVLAAAHFAQALKRAPRANDGRAGEDAAGADCPCCGRPFILALQWSSARGYEIRLLAVRTEADVRMACGAPNAVRELADG